MLQTLKSKAIIIRNIYLTSVLLRFYKNFEFINILTFYVHIQFQINPIKVPSYLYF